jgi:DNA-binding beta-propeller fold protein YncE
VKGNCLYWQLPGEIMIRDHLKSLKIKLNKKTVVSLILVIFLLESALFAYFYISKRSPAGLLHNSPISVVTPQAPVPLYGIYGDSTTGNLQKPMAVTVYGNKIFVSDTGNQRIVVFDYDGNPLYTFGKAGIGKGEFQFPYGITVDNSGQLYVADLANGKISIFDQTGKFIKYFAQDQKNVIGKPAGLFFFNNQIFTTDVQQCKVMAFTLDGKKVLEFGKNGEGDGDLNSPNAVTVTNQFIYVSDSGNNRIEKFDRTGKFLQSNYGGGTGQANSGFINTRGIAVDSRGIMYAVSNLTNKIWGFDNNDKKVFEPVGDFGNENNQFNLPNGMFIDAQGRIYITDTQNQRVMVYQN